MRQIPIVVLLCAGVVAQQAHAEVLVEGSATALRVSASRAPVAEILAALKTKMGVRYPNSVTLDQPITANFSGSLEQVVARVLDSYNYVLRQAPDDAIEILFVERRDNSATAVVTKPARPAGAPASAAINPAAPGGQTSIGRIRPK